MGIGVAGVVGRIGTGEDSTIGNRSRTLAVRGGNDGQNGNVLRNTGRRA